MGRVPEASASFLHCLLLSVSVGIFGLLIFAHIFSHGVVGLYGVRSGSDCPKPEHSVSLMTGSDPSFTCISSRNFTWRCWQTSHEQLSTIALSCRIKNP